MKSDETRFDRGSWRTLTAAIIFVILCLLLVGYRLTLPADGWSYPFNVSGGLQQFVLGTYGAQRPTALQQGDLLLAIEGQSIEEIVGRALRLQPDPPANWTSSSLVPYTVQRVSLDVHLPVTLAPRTLVAYLQLLAQWALYLQLGLTLQALIALFIFVRRPGNRAAQLFLLWNAVIITNMLSVALSGQNGAPAELFSLIAYWPTVFFNILVYPLLIVPALAHVFLVFPVMKAPMRRRPKLTLAAIYGLPALVLFSAILANLDRPLFVMRVPIEIGPLVIFLPSFVIAIVSLAHTLVKDSSAVRRAQARWLLIGLILSWGIGNGALFFAGELGLVQKNWFFSLVSALLILAFPLSLLITIFRYRLFDIDVIIRRTLVYGALTALLLLIYFGSVVLMETLVQALTGQQGTSPIAIVLSTLIIAALFTPLRRRVQDLIDRRFYRRKYDAAQTLAQFAQAAREEVELDVLTGELLRVVQETMQPEFVALTLSPTTEDAPKGSDT